MLSKVINSGTRKGFYICFVGPYGNILKYVKSSEV